MLQLRSEQLEALRAHAIEQYVDRSLAQFKQFFPRHCEINGDEPMRDMIRYGVGRAERHNILAERNVVLYNTMMLLFGSYFDDDPMTPWAKHVLSDSSLGTENERAERLYGAGQEHWEQVWGEDGSQWEEAIIRLCELDMDGVANEPEERWPNWMMEVFPSRCRVMGSAGLSGLLRSARRCAVRHRLTAKRAEVALCGAKLLFGYRVERDPMHRWLRENLKGRLAGDEEARAERLLAAVREYASAWKDASRGRA